MSSQRSPMRWQNTIQFRFSLGVGITFLTMIAAIYWVVNVVAKDYLIQKNQQLTEETGSLIVSELSRQISIAETLTRTLAQAGENLPKDPDLYHKIIPNILNIQGYQEFVAGGGIWPEPGQFNPDKKQRSFFWARDSSGQLQFLAQYNQPDSAGYHNQEWYVPARYTNPGECIWSKSYMDPYSFEPMVTCTVAMFKQQQFVGSATVDIKLQKLQSFLQKGSAKLGGYAFAVDRNNKFLSYPDLQLTKIISHQENNQTKEFITANALAKKDDSFSPIASILEAINRKFVNSLNLSEQKLAQKISQDSYQITAKEALLIAANLSVLPDNALSQNKIVSMMTPNDLLLNEPAIISVFLIPNTMWKIVIVTPQRLAVASAERVANLVLAMIITIMIIAAGIGFIQFRRTLIIPVYQMVNQFQDSPPDQNLAATRLLGEDRKDEFGLLAYHFNQSTRELDRKNYALQLQIKERKQAEEQLKYLALHDPLTNLPNRLLFQDRLEQAISQAKRHHNKFAVLFMDLDNFKIINDTQGHEVGDQLLIQVAQRINTTDRKSDTVARLGGDEFAFIVNELQSPNDAMNFAQRLIQMFNLPIITTDHDITIGTSIGITIYPDDATTSRELLRNADIAMYQAKEDGRNTSRFFVNEMNIKLQENKQLLSDLTVSLVNNDFELYYQPLFDLISNEMVGAEALIRWHHPTKGMIPPLQFISVAEQSGLINELGDWVLSQTCLQIKTFIACGLPPFRIAINISPVQFRRKNFLQQTLKILESHGVESRYLELEITEGMVMDNVDEAIATMQALHDAGFKLSIDDFGTGYSSLSYLKRFPIQKVKIDRSFISDIEHDDDSKAITIAIIQMSHTLGLQVLAEGVENEQQLNILQQEKCDFVQGYFKGRPMPAAQLIERFGSIDVTN
ncbi:MAG: EAL domain-containing protein [Gammaproteobacteria bacterium]|nr:EAL domain-containing protein [Gammaproteobacteria bacterium]